MQLDEWLPKARSTNPGVSDDALTEFWFDRYGGGPEKPETGFVSDTGKLLKSGFTGLATSAREVGRRVFGTGVADALDKFDEWTGYVPAGPGTFDERLAAKQSEIEAGMSPETRAARDKMWWRSDADTEAGKQSAWTDPRAYYAAVVESTPGTVASMGPTGLLARKLGVMAFEKALSSGAAEQMAAKMTAENAAKGLGAVTAEDAAKAIAGKVVGKAAYVAGGASEGLQQAGQSGYDVRTAIEKMPWDKIDQSDAFQALWESNIQSGMGEQEAAEKARKQLASDASAHAMILAGVATGLFGGSGDAMLAKMMRGEGSKSLLGRVAQGIVAEGAFEEAPQSGLSKLAENSALREADPSQDLTQGVLNETIGGAVAGGIMGGGMAAPFKPHGSDQGEIDLKTAVDRIMAPGTTTADATAVAVAWTQEQTKLAAQALSQAIGRPINEDDVFANPDLAQGAILHATARGETAVLDPFEVNVLGTPTQGVMVNRNAPLVPEPDSIEPSINTATEAEAGAIDTTGRRQVDLTPSGFTSTPVDKAEEATRIADLNEAQRQNGERLMALSEKAAKEGDVPKAAKIAGLASIMRQFNAQPVEDAKVPGAAFARGVARLFGADVQFFKAEGQHYLGGSVIEKQGRRILYVNVKAARPHMEVMGHELSHYLEQKDPAGYTRMVDILRPLMYGAALKEVGDRYKGLSQDAVEKELVGDLFGREIAGKKLWQLLKQKDEPLFKQVAKRVIEFIDTVLKAITGGKLTVPPKLVNDITTARAAVADLVHANVKAEVARREQTKANARAEIEARTPGTEAHALGATSARDKSADNVPPSKLGGAPLTVTTEEGQMPMMRLDVEADRARVAFGKGYKDLNGVTVEEQVGVDDSKETVTVERDAGKAMREFDRNDNVLSALKACLA